MKIVFVTRSLEFGGAERQLAALAEGLQRHGHDVTILSLYSQVPLAEGLKESGVTVDIVGKQGRWDVLSFASRLMRRIRAHGPDVIHSYMPGANLICAVLRPFLPRVPLVWGVRSSDVDLRKFEWLTGLFYRAEPILSFVPDLIITNSQAGLEHAAEQGYPSPKMAVVPNGCDVERFTHDENARQRVRTEWNVAQRTPLVGLVARLDPFKDHPMFLEAAAAVIRTRPDARFVCVGDDPAGLRSGLESLASRLGIEHAVRFEPARSDIRDVYSALDVLCSSSTTEGFPNVLAEAMACETPCVATDAGDSRHIVGDTGIIVARRDAAAMARAILELLDRPSAGAGARERIVSEFSLESLVRRTETLLRGIVTSR
jgi:glycosyltransferase involved in cell wall biosynthesis